MAGPVTFPAVIAPFTAGNTQTPFTKGVWAAITTTGTSMFGGSVIGSAATHKLVPLINGRRRLAVAFP
jgi:hypothetical protein